MPASVMCPNLRCRKILSAPDEMRGKVVRCQHCQCRFIVPDSHSKPVIAAPKPAAA